MPKAKVKKAAVTQDQFIALAGNVLCGLATNPCRPTPEDAAATALSWAKALVSQMEK